MKIELRHRIELTDLVNFISEKRSISYSEAEKIIPWFFFEGGTISAKYSESDWSKEVVEYLKENNIEVVDVYQDC